MLLKCIVRHWIKTENNPYEFYGIDFSDGKPHEVTDERHIKKLLQSGFFEEVLPQKTDTQQGQRQLSYDSKADKNGKGARRNGNHHKS